MEEIIFRRPALEDQELIRSYFDKAPSRSCERTFVDVFLWARHYDVTFAVIEDTLVFRDGGDDPDSMVHSSSLDKASEIC